ncbi:MAG: hypothetical protein MJE66_03610 [Proteobacteria bacterium]|nr:hypothetical protein [Pseudomonadota bacterium]
MRKEYGRALRELFDTGLGKVAPEYERVSISSPYLSPPERTYRFVASETLHCWILLCPHPSGHEAFTVEVGWSREGRFPALSVRPSPVLDPAAAEDQRECVLRVPWLRDGGDAWWELPNPAVSRPGDTAALQESLEPMAPERAEALVGPLVDDALEALATAGLPYLARSIARAAATREPAPAFDDLDS